MPEASGAIYWILDEDGNVLPDFSTYAGDYNVGDRLVLEGKTRRIVERVSTEDHRDVIWVKTVAEAE